jgi:hypothetical protein
MKKQALPRIVGSHVLEFAFLFLWSVCTSSVGGAPATLLFEDQFNGGIPGWTAIQPAGGNYLDGPMLWQYDVVSDAFSEQSNLYSDSATFSVTRIASMCINDTVAPSDFTYTARLTAGDDDGFGLIWGFQNEGTFYRVIFARQNRAGWPFTGWALDRSNNGQITDLFGAGTPNFVPTFVNAAWRPFDVTVSITNSLLTLTIVDDPDVSHVVYDLVANQPLPAAAAGKVGFVSWGQAGGNPRSFRIQNPILSPTPLTGDLSALLTNWSFLITPRGDGTTNHPSGLEPVWGHGLSINGNRGTLIENSDWTTDNIAAATTNFPAPSAVAGDVNWSNYVYTARFISSDNDGFGMLLRFQNETNFYRIAFRNQNSTAGIKRGISIQKNVNLLFDQIFASTTFIPPTAVPIDVYASINGNRLQVMVVSNPANAAPQTFFFGPFDITNGTVDNGKIGVFSWAQYNEATQTASDAGTEVDFVKVQQVAGEGLIVASPFGAPNPPVGLNDFPVSSVITASVDNVVIDAPGVRRVAVGWEGFGSAPASGSTNQVTFTLSTFSLITWKWRTDFLLTTAGTNGGQVTATAGSWIPQGTNVTVTAVADPGHLFIGWAGDSASTSSNLSFSMIRPVTLTAMFAADSDGDGLADSWEIASFGNLGQTAAGDPDNDGVSNGDEFRRGSDPNYAEALAASDGLSSQWINTQRDPVLPGQLGVVDFAPGYRGAYDNSNDNRFGNDATFVGSTNLLADFASFQSSRVIIRSNLWDASWAATFSASIEFIVGDNDGNCFYFRYRDEQNWYRVTVCGEAETITRPRLGVSVQSRVNGKYAEIPGTVDPGIFTDPLDTTGYKRVRVTINATNENFEVRVIGWNSLLATPIFDPASERIVAFTDTNHATGRIGFGLWGQGGFGGPNATNGIPVPSGALVDNIVLTVGGSNVFTETWETAALTNGFPTGWTNPLAGAGPGTIEGDWQVSAHGTIMQLSNFGPSTTGTEFAPKADTDGPILLAPSPGVENYLLELGFHPFDDDGIGLVYNFFDTNNYSRVLFVSESTGIGRVPQGLTVSRKRNGQWSDLVLGDGTFIYHPGQPFAVEFANNNGACRLRARELDNPALVYEWQWQDDAGRATNRFGLATWGETDAHFLYARAFKIPTQTVVGELQISSVALSGNNIVLGVSKPAAMQYDVQIKTNLMTATWTTVESGQTASQWTGPIPAGISEAYWRLRRNP